MGKVRVKSFGDLEEDAKAKRLEEKRSAKKEAKKAEKAAEEPSVEEVKIPGDTAEIKEEKAEEEKPQKKAKSKAQKTEEETHSQKYNDFSAKVDKTKTYALSEALDLLATMQRGKFDETVELHINTVTPGISGTVTFPHGTGKKTRVVVADEAIIAEVEKGTINFDILVATPDMMPKLARVAKVLGPRGLMPNPKNGTITQKPEEVVKKYEGGQISFKTEAKNPLLHLTVGKMSFGNEKLTENIDFMISAVKKGNIVNVTLKSTMSPGIKVKV